VVLDVVFNHSAEGDALGPTLSWRGLDNASWYLHERAGHLLNFSGCGNSLNLAQPCAQRLVMDSLRWWVQAFGVDGFRFDLAAALGRDVRAHHHFQPHAGLLAAMAQDPVLARVRLIAEPWDLGPNGYQLGHFPLGWLEWNDRFRDSCRAWWLGHETTRGELARRLSGSSDVFHHSGRSPQASVNLITAHDGMTLADLTAYAHKHNQANGEDNRDGHAHNLSTNNGIEGDTDVPAVLALRARQQRVLLATLLLSLGTPMLLAGDEIGHSQRGNNNAYCQDNTITWLAWAHADQALCTFVQSVLALRQRLVLLQAGQWWQTMASAQGPAAYWCDAAGQPLSAAAWDDPRSQALALQLQGAGPGVLLLLNPQPEPVTFALPPGGWQLQLDTSATTNDRLLGATETLPAGTLWLAVAESGLV
jgi:glycogen operon protein